MTEIEEVHYEEDTFGLGCALEVFTEYKEVLDMIDNLKNVVNSNQSTVEGAYERFIDILKQYHEQPHLLDSHLESILSKIIDIVRDKDNLIVLKHEAFKYLYFIINVRGYKVIVRQLPHEVADFEPVLKLLEAQDPNDPDTWTTRYVLLLWMSIIVMIPFHMSRLDGFKESEDESNVTVMTRVLNVCKTYIVVPDKCRDSAAYLISKFVTRIDVKEKHLDGFLNWACELSSSNESSGFVKYGTLSSVAMILKHSKREDILPFTRKLLEWIINAEFKNHPGSNIQKLVYKIVQRIGLTFLPPIVATWRYQRGNRSLAGNMSSGDAATPTGSSTTPALPETDSFEVPEEIEEVIDQLIQGLRSTDSVVRWSAAKGIGRVTSRLPKDLADEVVGSVLELFSPRESDGAWQGGCLALAELGRRGLLLPQRLPEVVPVVIKALVYDEPRGYSSVGSHIRDAACYVCWSFARAYNTDDLQPFVKDIASQLLIVTCFDREINCRRAASAAFQENVGRQGTFPHGIDILTMADFFTVSVRNTAYLGISTYIAQFDEYTIKLIDHLVQRKVIHWDIQIRELASKALHNLTEILPDYMVNSVLPSLFVKTKNIDLNYRHGSVIAVGEILHALSLVVKKEGGMIEDKIGLDNVENVKKLIPEYRERLYFKGMGGELMRLACYGFIEKCSMAKIPFHKMEIIEDWLVLINESLSYDVENIRRSAIQALSPLLNEYYQDDEEKCTKLVKRYIKELKSETNKVTRMGYALALGSLPLFILDKHVDNIITELLHVTNITFNTSKWAESRRDSIKALTMILVTMEEKLETDISKEVILKIMCCFLTGLTEYTQDNRGDIGAWVREASMLGLQTITILISNKNPEYISAELVSNIFSSVTQQAVEKIDRTRALAGKVFYNLLHNEPKILNIPNYDELIVIFPKDIFDSLNWYSAATTFSKFVLLIKFPAYSYNILLGLVCSIGGMTETLVKNSSSAFFDFLSNEDTNEILRICETIYQIFVDNQRVDRITIPMFRFLEKMFSSGCINEILENDDCDFPKKTLKLIQMEINGCKDIYKLIDGINILCQFIQVKNDVAKTALVQLSILLCHRQPYVRKSTSSRLFEALLLYGDNSIIPVDNLDDISNLLSSTNWEDSVEELKLVRNTLCNLMDVRVPVSKKK